MEQDAGSVLIGLAILVVIVALTVFFLITLQRTLTLAGPQSRTMSPGLVWLNLIPIFNFGWMIYTVLKVSETIQNRHSAAGVEDAGRGARTIGLAYGILSITTIIPVIGGLTGIATVVCWIIYWVKLAGYNATMETMAG